jgi:hypothetical protein
MNQNGHLTFFQYKLSFEYNVFRSKVLLETLTNARDLTPELPILQFINEQRHQLITFSKQLTI